MQVNERLDQRPSKVTKALNKGELTIVPLVLAVVASRHVITSWVLGNQFIIMASQHPMVIGHHLGPS